MKRASLQNRVLAGSVLAVAGTLGVTGVAVHRVAQARLRANGRDALCTVLEISAQRVAAESIFAARTGEDLLGEIPGITRQDEFWAVRHAREAGDLMRTTGFPPIELENPEWNALGHAKRGRTATNVRETLGEDGLAYRVANLVHKPWRPGGPGMRRGEMGGPWPGAGRGPGPGRGGNGPRRTPNGFPFDPDDEFLVFVAVPIQGEVDSLAELAELLGMAGIGAVLVAALAIRFAVRRGLSPLAELSRQVAAIRETDLDESIQIDEAPAELAPIITSFDATRERLAKAFAREKRFTADAAHELRTPVAGMRATLEVALRRKRSTSEHREAATQCLDIALTMQATIESLLLLARSGRTTAERGPVHIEEALQRGFAAVAMTLESRELTVCYRARETQAGAVMATGIPSLFERIAANLAGNAASHSTRGSTIDVDVSAANGVVALQISNSCDALPEDANERAFEPFWRADVARTDRGAHTGLGLALVRTCVEAMDGAVTLTTENARFSIRITLPQ